MMNESKPHEINADSILLRVVRVLDSSINSVPSFDMNKLGWFMFDSDLLHSINLNMEMIKFVFNINITGIDKQGLETPVNCHFSIEYIFEIDDLQYFVIENSEEQNDRYLNTTLATVLAGMVYSTARGIIFSKTEGVILNGIILEVIDPQTLIT